MLPSACFVTCSQAVVEGVLLEAYDGGSGGGGAPGPTAAPAWLQAPVLRGPAQLTLLLPRDAAGELGLDTRCVPLPCGGRGGQPELSAAGLLQLIHSYYAGQVSWALRLRWVDAGDSQLCKEQEAASSPCDNIMFTPGSPLPHPRRSFNHRSSCSCCRRSPRRQARRQCCAQRSWTWRRCRAARCWGRVSRWRGFGRPRVSPAARCTRCCWGGEPWACFSLCCVTLTHQVKRRSAGRTGAGTLGPPQGGLLQG